MQHEITNHPLNGAARRAAIAAALAVVIAAGGSWPAIAGSEPVPSAAASRPAAAPAIELNSASVKQLQSVPGIGPATAARIVAFREEHGPFRRVEDLIKIRGIGETTFQKIRQHVRVVRAD